ncbi:MAG: hypothetical protein AAF512_10980 [Pseudomonadota bacterium]
MPTEKFSDMLQGGHPNSLGRTVEVVELVLQDAANIAELFECYNSNDEVVRLRTSNAFKRVFREHPDWIKPWVDPLLDKIDGLNQPSAQWTLAQLCHEVNKQMTSAQNDKAIVICKRFLEESADWIVIKSCIEYLGTQAIKQEALRPFLKPYLEKYSQDSRKTVSKKAKHFLDKFFPS